MKNKLKTKEEMIKFYNEMIEICEKEKKYIKFFRELY